MNKENMNTDQLIDSIIERQILEGPSEFLNTKIMAKVENIHINEKRTMRRYLSVAYGLCFAVSIACSIYIGINIEKKYFAKNSDVITYSTFDIDEIESQFLIKIK